LAHLEQLIDSYLASPENARYSAEQASRGAFKPPIGDAHTDRWLLWTQSELLAAMLDLSIRDATGGKRSLDDLMRAMYANFPGERGFTTMDVERLAGEVSGRSLKPFFDAYVSGAGKIDFDQFLRLAGLKMEFQRKRATAPDGTLLPDRRVYVMLPNGESFLKLYFDDPNSGWLRAGLLNGDQLLKFNGSVVETESDFNGRLEALHVRDRVKLEVMRAGTMRQVTVAIESFDSPDVKIRELADTSNRQKAIFAKWNAGQ
jgi:predicted metalloprotease with PDZ domain